MIFAENASVHRMKHDDGILPKMYGCLSAIMVLMSFSNIICFEHYIGQITLHVSNHVSMSLIEIVQLIILNVIFKCYRLHSFIAFN